MTVNPACPQCGAARIDDLRFCPSCGYDYGLTSGSPPDETSRQPDGAQAVSTVTQPAPVAPGAPPAAVPEQSRTIQPAAIAVIAGGALIAIGSFLPWVTASTVFGSISRSGVDGGGDGYITLVAGAVITLVGLASMNRPSRATNVIIAIGAAIVGLIFVIDFSDVQGRVADLEAEGDGMALGSVGIGLWLVGLGAVISFIASFMRRSSHKNQAP